MSRSLFALLTLIVLSTPVLAGRNSAGVLLVHYNSDISVPQAPAFVDGSLTTCAGAIAQAPTGATILWHVYAAFPLESSPRLKVVTFGCEFDANRVAVLWSATRPGTIQIFYPDASSWPYTGSGTAVGFQDALTATVDEVYCFAGYGYQGETFAVVAHPDQGGTFADDGIPSALDTIEGYGALGFGVPGSIGCPQGGSGVDPDAEAAVVRLTLSGGWPSPSSAWVSWDLQRRFAGTVHLKVARVDGRCVRSWAERALPAGTTQIRWDGLDQSGMQVASGRYYLIATDRSGNVVKNAATILR